MVMTKRLFLFAAAVACAVALTVALSHAAPGQPAVGSPAPEVVLTSNEGSRVDLKDYRGKWVVLYFYPKDFSSGCTLEAHNSKRDLKNYQQRTPVPLGVGGDRPEPQKSFCAAPVSTLTPRMT